MSVSVISWVAELQKNSYSAFYMVLQLRKQRHRHVKQWGGLGELQDQVCLEAGVFAERDRAGV